MRRLLPNLRAMLRCMSSPVHRLAEVKGVTGAAAGASLKRGNKTMITNTNNKSGNNFFFHFSVKPTCFLLGPLPTTSLEEDRSSPPEWFVRDIGLKK